MGARAVRLVGLEVLGKRKTEFLDNGVELAQISADRQRAARVKAAGGCPKVYKGVLKICRKQVAKNSHSLCSVRIVSNRALNLRQRLVLAPTPQACL